MSLWPEVFVFLLRKTVHNIFINYSNISIYIHIMYIYSYIIYIYIYIYIYKMVEVLHVCSRYIKVVDMDKRVAYI